MTSMTSQKKKLLTKIDASINTGIDSLIKHGSHDQSTHGNWAKNVQTRRILANAKKKKETEGFGRGRKKITIPATGNFKEKTLKMRPSVLKKIESGWKSKFDDVGMNKDDFADMTPYIRKSDYTSRGIPVGGVADWVNQTIGAQIGRADAYYRHAMTLDPKDPEQNKFRQSLLYKAEEFIKLTNKTLRASLKNELKKLEEKVETYKHLHISKSQQKKMERFDQLEKHDLPFEHPDQLHDLLIESEPYLEKEMPEDLVVKWESVDDWIDGLIGEDTDEE